MIIFLTAFWQAGSFIGFFMGIFFAFRYGWEAGLLSGAIGGFLLGLLIASFVYLQSRKITQNRRLTAAEKLIGEGIANYQGNGGWIYLTDSRLFYVSSKPALKPHELSFPLSDIVSAENNRTFGLFRSKLTLHLRNGKREEFFVQDAKNWVNQINKVSNLSLETQRESLYL